MDFGWDHPFAAVELVWDRDTDTVYVTRTHRLERSNSRACTRRRFDRGARTCLGHGRETAGARRWKAPALRCQSNTPSRAWTCCSTHAQFDDGSVSVEAGLMDMLTRMQTGRFKVFKHLNDWFEEFRLYHRKDGKVVKEGDDLMAATRYGVMMLRHATTAAATQGPRPATCVFQCRNRLMTQRRFVTWNTLNCEHGSGSWSVVRRLHAPHVARSLSGVYAATWMLELRSQRQTRRTGRRPAPLLLEVLDRSYLLNTARNHSVPLPKSGPLDPAGSSTHISERQPQTIG